MELVSVGCIMYHIVVSYVYVADVPRIEKEGFGQLVFRSTRTPNQKKDLFADEAFSAKFEIRCHPKNILTNLFKSFSEKSCHFVFRPRPG